MSYVWWLTLTLSSTKASGVLSVEQIPSQTIIDWRFDNGWCPSSLLQSNLIAVSIVNQFNYKKLKKLCIYHERPALLVLSIFGNLTFLFPTVIFWHSFIFLNWYPRLCFTIFQIISRLMFIILWLFSSKRSDCVQAYVRSLKVFVHCWLFVFYLNLVFPHYGQSFETVSQHSIESTFETFCTRINFPFLQGVMWETHFLFLIPLTQSLNILFE